MNSLNKIQLVIIFGLLFFFFMIHTPGAQERSDGCTSITVGKAASWDGSVMTSHTMDEHRARAWIDIQPQKTFPDGSKMTLYKMSDNDSTAMPSYKEVRLGEIPQVLKTFGYINTSLPCLNDQQLAIGESTFGGRESLQSDKGLIDLWRLVTLLIERCTTAREAIQLADELTKEYGWRDVGECLTIADPREVWHFEIVGPGRGKVGSIWAAQRVPDDHISVNANASRIRQVDTDNPEFFLASENLTEVALDSGWWNPAEGPFQFNYAYDPEGRQSLASRRREWRVLSLLAPSVNLLPESENYPFSVKPDSQVTLPKMVSIFQDYYEGTDYNPVKNITWQNPEGIFKISPLANPFMPYDMLPLFKINGGWGWRGERTIARWYTMYATIIQCRDWLPNPIGGVAWLGLDNVATSVYIPVYAGTADLPASYKVPGRITGYTRESAWWAFNRLSTLTAQRWGDMRKDVAAKWNPLQNKLFNDQKTFETEAMEIYKKNQQSGLKFLTDYSLTWGQKIFEEAWKLGDYLWTKYDEKF
ncbi:MAG: C69 family dipeptidase [bacterium]|nr:MAG: C69 family dipeptidase [bacterium]